MAETLHFVDTPLDFGKTITGERFTLDTWFKVNPFYEPELREALDEIFSGLEYIEADDSEMVATFLKSLHAPLQCLRILGFRILCVRTRGKFENDSVEVAHYIVVGSECYFSVRASRAGKRLIHKIDESCKLCNKDLTRGVLQNCGVEIFATQQLASEAVTESVVWCQACCSHEIDGLDGRPDCLSCRGHGTKMSGSNCDLCKGAGKVPKNINAAYLSLAQPCPGCVLGRIDENTCGYCNGHGVIDGVTFKLFGVYSKIVDLQKKGREFSFLIPWSAYCVWKAQIEALLTTYLPSSHPYVVTLHNEAPKYAPANINDIHSGIHILSALWDDLKDGSIAKSAADRDKSSETKAGASGGDHRPSSPEGPIYVQIKNNYGPVDASIGKSEDSYSKERRMGDIKIENFQGILNTGEIRDVEHIELNISQLRDVGEKELADSLQAFTVAVAQTEDLDTDQRAEVIARIEDISEEAAEPPARRAPKWSLKDKITGVSEIIQSSSALANLWEQLRPLVEALFSLHT